MLNSFFSRNTLSLEVLARTIAVQMFTEEIKSAVEKLSSGGVVGIPTDTLYGLAANLFDETALDRIYQIKGRPQKLALPVLISNTEQLQMVSDAISKTILKLARQFWPGPLTLVLPKNNTVSYIATGGLDTIAVRIPNHRVPLAIIDELGFPITGTSANLSGKPDLITIESVESELGDHLDGLLKCGPRPLGIASTVVDVSSNEIAILREGVIKSDEIFACL